MRKKNGCPPAKKQHPSATNKPRFFFLYLDHALCNQCAIVKTESRKPLINKGFAAHRILLKLDFDNLPYAEK